jgi:nitroimidazol reductase NimA-like FMN-containing flavoprotein (pyridoxamine 5'-phosphate oxidase superfamily)
MVTIIQPPVPAPAVPSMKKHGVKIKKFKSTAEFEKVLVRFLKRNNILHLSTCLRNMPRSTPLEYRLDGLTFYILSEGGGKFVNLKSNKNISFSIAEPYYPKNDFWGYKGVQAWGKAHVYSRRENPRQFEKALKTMKVYEALKALGVAELAAQFNYRVIVITPDVIKYGNPREGVFRVTWKRKG